MRRVVDYDNPRHPPFFNTNTYQDHPYNPHHHTAPYHDDDDQHPIDPIELLIQSCIYVSPTRARMLLSLDDGAPYCPPQAGGGLLWGATRPRVGGGAAQGVMAAGGESAGDGHQEGAAHRAAHHSVDQQQGGQLGQEQQLLSAAAQGAHGVQDQPTLQRLSAALKHLAQCA